MNRLLCFIGCHSWSAFIHIPSRCVDEKFCKSCYKTVAQDSHRYGKWERAMQDLVAYVDGEVKVTGRQSIQNRWCNDCNFQESERAFA